MGWLLEIDYTLTLTKLKYMWNKCANNKTKKLARSSRIYKVIIYHKVGFPLIDNFLWAGMEQ